MARRGRPSKFDPAYAERIIKHMANGLSFESFGGEIGVHKDTLYEWVKRYPDFADAKKKATERCRLWWERLGMAALMGRDVVDAQGKVTIEGKRINTVLWIFNMKCRFREEWREDAPAVDARGGTFTLNYQRKPKVKP